MKKTLITLVVVLVGLNFSSCTKKQSSQSALQGSIIIDGSSTVYPITEAVAEEFRHVHPDVRVTVGVSGTGGGFKKFTIGEIDINDASREIKDQEIEQAKKNGIQYTKFAVAYDGISVVLNPKNNWVDHLTSAELKKIWEPNSKVKTWKDIRAAWPDKEIKLYGPGADSGTFDYFTEAINGKSHVSRSDFTKSEDDNVLVMGVEGDQYAMGYFGYAYYKENKDKLKVAPIDGGKGPVVPTEETINNSTYEPLSRPIFIYVSHQSLQRKEVQAFVKFYLENAGTLSETVGYVSLPKDQYETSLLKLQELSSKKLTNASN